MLGMIPDEEQNFLHVYCQIIDQVTVKVSSVKTSAEETQMRPLP